MARQVDHTKRHDQRHRRERMLTVSAFCILACSIAVTGYGLQPLATGAYGPAESSAPQSVSLPRPTGPHSIGRTSLALVDDSRREVMTDDPDDHREVLLHVWYPAAAGGANTKAAPYVDIDPTNPVFQNDYRRFGPERLPSVRTNSMAEPHVSSAQSRYPVLVFSHGLGTISSLYSIIIEHLTSHGYVVVGVEHPFYASAFRFPDGRLVKRESRRPPDKVDATASEREQLRSIREAEGLEQAQDLVFVLNTMEVMNRNALRGELWGRLDLSRVGVFGHSRGGFAAPHACFSDLRFKACLNLDGYRLTEAVMRNGITQPYMHIQEIPPWEPPPTAEQLRLTGQTPQEAHGQMVAAAREWDTCFRQMKSGAYVVTISGARHMSFSDGPYIAPDLFADIPIDARRALSATNTYVTAFFDRYLQGRVQPLLASQPPFREVTLEVFEPGKPYTRVYRAGD